MSDTVNPFEAGTRKVIPAVLIYARSGDRILMLHRNSGKREVDGKPDYHAGKWNGLGGKCELDESPIQAAQRELEEESGLVLPESAFRALGVLQFPNFKAHRSEDWLVYVFSAEVDAQKAANCLAKGPEGDLHWIPGDDLTRLNLWPGDQYFLPWVRDGKAFIGTIWYAGETVRDVWIQKL